MYSNYISKFSDNGSSEKSIIALVDCNSFYASCEKVFRPELKNRPVIVLSNNDGCIIARSAEAKKLGVKMGEPYFKSRHRLEKMGVHVFSSNYALYGDLSDRITNILRDFSPNIEVYSIDESFIDLSGFSNRDLHKYGEEIRDKVRKWTGVPVSIGISSTKTLAKVANHIAKKSRKTCGVLRLEKPEHIERALAITPIEDVWGIGRRWGKKMRNYGIETALKLSETNPEWIRKNFNVVAQKTALELRGKPCITLEIGHVKRQSITSSRSFGTRTGEISELKSALANFVSRATKKLRSDSLAAGKMLIFIYTDRFKEDDPQYKGKIEIKLPNSTDDTRILVDYAQSALEKIFRKGYLYKKAGVILSEIVPKHQVQMNLFHESDRISSETMMDTLDNINRRMGSQKLGLASTLGGSSWKMRSEMLSPRYTTNWAQLPVVR